MNRVGSDESLFHVELELSRLTDDGDLARLEFGLAIRLAHVLHCGKLATALSDHLDVSVHSVVRRRRAAEASNARRLVVVVDDQFQFFLTPLRAVVVVLAVAVGLSEQSVQCVYYSRSLNKNKRKGQQQTQQKHWPRVFRHHTEMFKSYVIEKLV